MKRSALSICVFALIMAATPALAQDSSFKIFGALNYVMPMSDENVAGLGTLEASDELGYELGFEWRATEKLGLEVSYLTANHDVELDGTKLGEIDLEPLSAALNIHFYSSDMVDVYAGPVVSYVLWSDVELVEPFVTALGTNELKTDSEFGYGATLGADFKISDALVIQTGLRWLFVDAPVDGVADVGVDPLFIRAGLGYRF
ncbi:MAG: OmpW family protein [Acidobacteria bacterium]|nr:OmpW family protein [Acidobacteriota bacterium]